MDKILKLGPHVIKVPYFASLNARNVCQNGNYVIHLWFDKHFSFAWIISPYFFQIILQCICAVLHCYFSPNLWYFDLHKILPSLTIDDNVMFHVIIQFAHYIAVFIVCAFGTFFDLCLATILCINYLDYRGRLDATLLNWQKNANFCPRGCLKAIW